jgi:TatD DNase family protein
MIIDTHAHLNFSAFRYDIDKVINRCLNNNIFVINVGSQFTTSRRAVRIAEGYYPQTKEAAKKGFYAAVGLHPLHLETGLVKIKDDPSEGKFVTKEEIFDYQKYKELAQKEKVVAIGEIGLDYYFKPKTKRRRELFFNKQKNLLKEQLKLAKELRLPVIFHCRMAHSDLIEFLRTYPELKPEKAVAHGFVGTVEELKEYLDFGYYIGFNGIIFKKINGIDFEKNIEKTPLDKILVETDCPYLIPPAACQKQENQDDSALNRNEPIFIKYIIEKIAEVKKESFEKIREATFQNAENLFNFNYISV